MNWRRRSFAPSICIIPYHSLVRISKLPRSNDQVIDGGYPLVFRGITGDFLRDSKRNPSRSMPKKQSSDKLWISTKLRLSRNYRLEV